MLFSGMKIQSQIIGQGIQIFKCSCFGKVALDLKPSGQSGVFLVILGSQNHFQAIAWSKLNTS